MRFRHTRKQKKGQKHTEQNNLHISRNHGHHCAHLGSPNHPDPSALRPSPYHPCASSSMPQNHPAAAVDAAGAAHTSRHGLCPPPYHFSTVSVNPTVAAARAGPHAHAHTRPVPGLGLCHTRRLLPPNPGDFATKMTNHQRMHRRRLLRVLSRARTTARKSAWTRHSTPGCPSATGRAGASPAHRPSLALDLVRRAPRAADPLRATLHPPSPCAPSDLWPAPLLPCARSHVRDTTLYRVPGRVRDKFALLVRRVGDYANGRTRTSRTWENDPGVARVARRSA